mmetsp:Transcript_134255/g.429008  ORF Transcript_134255/g.429008 Transcript_134255/m.429008 type:complete len:259 (+) Transcript_134255:975-1751(+)
MFAHAASAATVVDRAPHVLPTSTILDGRCGITHRRRAADALRQLHSLPSPREVLWVRHRIMRDHRADIGGTAGESHRALGLRLAEGRADGEGVRLQGPRLALQGVLQRRGLRRIEERQEGEHEVRLRRRRVLLGRDRRAAPCCGLQDRAGVSRRVRLRSCCRDRSTHHLRECGLLGAPSERREASRCEVPAHCRQVLHDLQADGLQVLLRTDAREEEQPRSVDVAAGHDDFFLGVHHVVGAVRQATVRDSVADVVLDQ